MFFIMRMMFWLAVVCVLLPGGGQTQKDEAQAPAINPLQAVSAASATYSDMRGFCERQADACAVGGQVAAALGHRAQEGARTLVDFISQQMSESGAGKADHKNADNKSAENKTTENKTTENKTAANRPASQNTLTAADIAPAWNGPAEAPAASVPLPPLPPRRDGQNRRPAA